MHHQQRIIRPSRREVIDVYAEKRDKNHKQKQNINIEENSAFEFEAKIYMSLEAILKLKCPWCGLLPQQGQAGKNVGQPASGGSLQFLWIFKTYTILLKFGRDIF